jgi:hypothetical protein
MTTESALLAAATMAVTGSPTTTSVLVFTRRRRSTDRSCRFRATSEVIPTASRIPKRNGAVRRRCRERHHRTFPVGRTGCDPGYQRSGYRRRRADNRRCMLSRYAASDSTMRRA